jgi:hypothetical protein
MPLLCLFPQKQQLSQVRNFSGTSWPTELTCGLCLFQHSRHMLCLQPAVASESSAFRFEYPCWSIRCFRYSSGRNFCPHSKQLRQSWILASSLVMGALPVQALAPHYSLSNSIVNNAIRTYRPFMAWRKYMALGSASTDLSNSTVRGNGCRMSASDFMRCTTVESMA